ncbi:hypothetical protein INT43_003595 [Umbelopsis isabellina]|uniref:Cas12f1-like TNB domain-containing protein n=1 Tax=Mortierella isabellina TaxID=91625 RepID=A0A8H7UFK3_MORIS|nr:hypothetical protein INT43_003595 [Umbelopsis isabellina]
MEQQLFIREPVPQTRATKGFVHRQLRETVDFRRLPRRFRSTLENHVRDSTNIDQSTIQHYDNHFFLENTRRPRTKASISRNEFRPQQFTDLRGSALSDKSFTGAIRTDGIALKFICERPSHATEATLTPVDIATEIDLNSATVWGLDPGLRDVFVACDGVGTGAGQSRQRHRFNEALRYIFRNFEAMKGYYTTGLKKLKYHNYRNKQKALTEMCKRLFTGSRKYQEGNLDIQQANLQKWKPLAPSDNAGEAERPTVVAFGSATLVGLRGNVPSPTKIFRKALLNYVKSTRRNLPCSRKYVVMIDEYFTSQICPRCYTRSTFNQCDNSNMKIHPVLNCRTCNTRWNRDHMARLNLRSILLYMAANNNNRPEEFRRDEAILILIWII